MNNLFMIQISEIQLEVNMQFLNLVDFKKVLSHDTIQ